MSSDRAPQYLRDIISNIDRIGLHTEDMDFAAYEKSAIAVDAVERCLQRITEAATRLQRIDNHILPMQNFDEMRGFGNRLRHDYGAIDVRIVWDTIEDDLPRLRADCETALKSLED